jgi:hypothetical protein
MKIHQPSNGSLYVTIGGSLYVTIGDYVYYFDDSTRDRVVQRWRRNVPISDRDIEDIQIEDNEE